MRIFLTPGNQRFEAAERQEWGSLYTRVAPDSKIMEIVQIRRWPILLGVREPQQHIMLLDEEGLIHGKADINPAATYIYLTQCVPNTWHPILGTVYICPSADYD